MPDFDWGSFIDDQLKQGGSEFSADDLLKVAGGDKEMPSDEDIKKINAAYLREHPQVEAVSEAMGKLKPSEYAMVTTALLVNQIKYLWDGGRFDLAGPLEMSAHVLVEMAKAFTQVGE